MIFELAAPDDGVRAARAFLRVIVIHADHHMLLSLVAISYQGRVWKRGWDGSCLLSVYLFLPVQVKYREY